MLRLSWRAPLYMLLASLLLFGTRSYSESQSEVVDIANFHRLPMLVGAFGAAVMFLLKDGASVASASLRMYCLFVALAWLSVLASTFPLYAAWKAFEITTALLVGILISHYSNGSSRAFEAYEIAIRYFKILIVLVFLGAIIFPSQALRPPLSQESVDLYGSALVPVQLFGVIAKINANSVGGICGVLLLVSVCRSLTKYTAAKLIWLLISATGLVLAQSRTAIAGVVVGLCLIGLMHPRIRTWHYLLIIPSALYVAYEAAGSLALYLTRGMDADRLSALSGRAEWWDAALTEFLQAPIYQQVFGQGYMTASRDVLANALNAEGAATLHSDYVDVLVSVGYFGEVVFICVVALTGLALLKGAIRYRFSEPLWIELIAVYGLLLIRSFTGTVLATHNFFLILTLILAACAAALSKRSSRMAPVSVHD